MKLKSDSDLVESISKVKRRLLDVATNPLLLSAIISIIIIFTLPSIFSKYTAKIVSQQRDVANRNVFYADLENDGISDEIITHQSYVDLASLFVSKNDKLINQWNFDGRLLNVMPGFWGDINGDGRKDVFIFTYRNDKILLSCVEPAEDSVLFKDKFVADYKPFEEKNLDCNIHPCGFYDENNDGKKDFYFSTDVSFSRSPRALFEFDPIKDTVLQSVRSFAGLSEPLIFDLEGKRNPDFIFATKAVGNCHTPVPYSDMFAWLMIFNSNLQFEFSPTKLGYYPSSCRVIPFISNGHKLIVVINIYKGTKGHTSSFWLFNQHGERIQKKEISYSNELEGVELYYNTDKKPNFFYMIKTNGEINRIDENLNEIKTESIGSDITEGFARLDLDGDGKKELIFQSADLSKLIIARDDFSNYTYVNCAGLGEMKSCSVILNGAKPPQLYALFNNAALTINYRFNELFYVRYPLYLAIFLVVLSVLLLIQKAQKHRAELKFVTERRMAELQLKSIKGQIDPHFTLNIINSIGSLFYKEDREKADYIFGKYSKLLRSTILNSDKILTTLTDELNYVENYLELERFRYSNKFSYEVIVGGAADLSVMIPKMLIHTFAENAVKHGLRHLERDGKLCIEIEKDPEIYTVKIRDNGVGRKKAGEIELDNTGAGLNILKQILELYYNLTKRKIIYNISDILEANGESSGTEVVIRIPVSEK